MGKQNMEKKERILRIAINLFLENSYSGTSTAQICTAAGIHKPSLYHFFESKRQLFYSCHMKSLEGLLEPHIQGVRSIREPRKRLDFIIREFTKMICLNPELRVLIHESMSIKDEYFEKVREKWKEHYLILKDCISELQRSGQIRLDLRPSWSALLLLGMITWITFWIDTSRLDEVEDLADCTTSIAFEGLFGK